METIKATYKIYNFFSNLVVYQVDQNESGKSVFTEHDVFAIISLGNLEICLGTSKVLFLIMPFFHLKW